MTPLGYMKLDKPTEAFAECLLLLADHGPGQREISRDFYWSDMQGALVEVVLQSTSTSRPIISRVQCRASRNGQVQLTTLAGR